MAEDKVIPADIQADADRLYKSAQVWNDEDNCFEELYPHEAKHAYIQGRLDERNKQNKSKL